MLPIDTAVGFEVLLYVHMLGVIPLGNIGRVFQCTWALKVGGEEEFNEFQNCKNSDDQFKKGNKTEVEA